MGGLTEIVNTYSAIGDDGVRYAFEPGARYDMPDRPVIDPAVIFFRGRWHYSAPRGAPQDGAHHAESADGLVFEPRPPFPSDMRHNWTGNFTSVDDTTLRFYGSGPQLWYAQSTDAALWTPYVPTNVNGGDPSVVRLSPDRWLMIYVGPRYVTSIEDQHAPSINVYPNPTTSSIQVGGLLPTDEVDASDLRGISVRPDLHDAPPGVYVVRITRGPDMIHRIVVKH